MITSSLISMGLVVVYLLVLLWVITCPTKLFHCISCHHAQALASQVAQRLPSMQAEAHQGTQFVSTKRCVTDARASVTKRAQCVRNADVRLCYVNTMAVLLFKTKNQSRTTQHTRSCRPHPSIQSPPTDKSWNSCTTTVSARQTLSPRAQL